MLLTAENHRKQPLISTIHPVHVDLNAREGTPDAACRDGPGSVWIMDEPLLNIAGECWRHSETENVLADCRNIFEGGWKQKAKSLQQSPCISLSKIAMACEIHRKPFTSSEAHRFAVAHGKLLVSHQDTSTQHDLLAIFFALLERNLLCFCKALDCNNPMHASIPGAQTAKLLGASH